jgi:hypothetical protein
LAINYRAVQAHKYGFAVFTMINGMDGNLCIALKQYPGMPEFLFWLFERILVVLRPFNHRKDVFTIESVACLAHITEKAGWLCLVILGIAFIYLFLILIA